MGQIITNQLKFKNNIVSAVDDNDFVTKWITFWSVIFGIGFVVIIGVPLSFVLNIWQDEGFTLHTTGDGPVYALQQAIWFEAQPPLYFIIESIWRLFNETSITFARLPSIVFAALTVGVIVIAAKRMAPLLHPFFVACFTAFNPMIIWAAVEMRVYALVLLIGAVLTWTFYEGFLAAESKFSRIARILYLLAAIAGLYTQYYIGFILIAHGITLLLMQRKQLLIFISFMIIVAATFAPFIGVVKMHVTGAGDMVVHGVSTITIIHQFANAVFTFILPHPGILTGIFKIACFGISALLVATLFIIGKPKINNNVNIKLVVQWLLCLTVFILVFSVLGEPRSFIRHLIVLVPSSILVAYMVMSSLTKMRKPLYITASIVFIVFTCVQFKYEYFPLTKNGDWQNLAGTIALSNAIIPIAVFPAELAVPLQVYLPITNLITFPKPMPFSIDYTDEIKLHSLSDVAQVLDPVYKYGKSKELWMITLQECHEPNPNDGYNFGCSYLQNYLDHHYHLVKEISFRGSLARLYERIDFSPFIKETNGSFVISHNGAKIK